MRFTIGKKLNSMILSLLLLGIGGAIYLATGLFTTDLVGQLKKGVMDVASLLAGRTRSEMRASAQRAQLLGAVSLQEFRYPEDRIYFLKNHLASEKQGVALSLYFRDPQRRFTPQWRVIEKNYQNRLNHDQLNSIDRTDPLDFSYLAKGHIDFKLAQLGQGIAVVRMAIPLVKNKQGEFTQILLLDLEQQKLTQLFSESMAFASYLIDRHGKVIASSDPSQLSTGTDLKNSPVFKAKNQSGRGTGQLDFTDLSGIRQLASYQGVGFADLTVVSQVPFSVVSAAKKKLHRRTAFLAATFLFLALAFGLAFSQQLTRPITRLASAAERVKSGDFTVSLPEKNKRKDGTIRGDEIQQFTATFNEMVKGLEEREQIKGVFEKFHNKEITEMLLSGEVKLGGERLEGTVFFSDIRGFTSLSEKHDPEVIVSLLNRYMSEMVSSIFQHSGVVDKYVGDAIMAVWGVPKPSRDSALMAVRCCLNMRERLNHLNEQFEKEGLPILRIGMGLNHGPLIAGNIGSEERMEYTVIGDTVNVASRIEASTKTLGVDCLISQSVQKLTAGKILSQPVDDVKAKGKSQSLKLFKVTGYIDKNGKEILVNTPYSEYPPEAETSKTSSESDKIAA